MTKAKSLFFILAMAVIFMGQPALAEEQTFEPFAVEVPDAWTAEHRPGAGPAGHYLKLTSPDRLSSITLSIEAKTKKQWDKMIEEMTLNPRPDTGPAQIIDDESFYVSFSNNGEMGREFYSRLPGDRMLKQVLMGPDPNLTAISASIKIVQPTN